MHIGVGMFATDYAIPIDELARETEARGFESLWVPELPISPRAGAPHGRVAVSSPWNTAIRTIHSSL